MLNGAAAAAGPTPGRPRSALRASAARASARTSSVVTIPVGTAITPYPVIIRAEARKRPQGVSGAMSPYPTVVSVTIAQYIEIGMLSKPAAGPSIRYMADPTRSTAVRTKERNTVILARLAARASPNTRASRR